MQLKLKPSNRLKIYIDYFLFRSKELRDDKEGLVPLNYLLKIINEIDPNCTRTVSGYVFKSWPLPKYEICNRLVKQIVCEQSNAPTIGVTDAYAKIGQGVRREFDIKVQIKVIIPVTYISIK